LVLRSPPPKTMVPAMVLTTHNIELLPKQMQCATRFQDDTTEKLLYGGGAGGGKSWVGCWLIVKTAIKYPGVPLLVGRSKLKALKETTLITMFQVLEHVGLKAGEHYFFNAQTNVMKFWNGSWILFKDLFLYPSDPLFNSLGSLEIVAAFIDEANQVSKIGIDTVWSRIRHKKHIDYNLKPKMLMTCNPDKNWVFADYYKPWANKTLTPDKCFIQALPTDNPHLPPHYINSLKSLDEIQRERLLYGNWEYDDDPTRLMDFNKISDIYTAQYVHTGAKYITADIAHLGSDLFTIFLWDGWRAVGYWAFPKSEPDEVEKKIKEIATENAVPRSHIVYDADGLGGYLRSYLANANPFVNNSKPFEIAGQKENYRNLKTQCYFYLGKLIQDGGVFVDMSGDDRDRLTLELGSVKRKNDANEDKIRLISKDKQKEALAGKSPDFADALMMRAWFDLDRQSRGKPSAVSSGEDLFGWTDSFSADNDYAGF